MPREPKWHIESPGCSYSYCGKWRSSDKQGPLLVYAEDAGCMLCLRAHIAFHRAEVIKGERRLAYIKQEAPDAE